MGEYKVNPNDPNVSTTADTAKKELNWSLEDLYNTEFTIDNLVIVLQVLDSFKRKYPDNKNIQAFEEIVRNEICHLFGGSIN